MKFFEKQILLFIACAVFSLSPVSCGGDKAKEADKPIASSEPGRTETKRRWIEESKNTIVAKINGAPVSGLDLVNEMNSIAAQYIKPGQAKDPKVDERIRKEALDRLIYRELAFQEAKRQGLKVPPGAVAEEMKRIRTEWKTEEGFGKYLAKSGTTEEELNASIERSILVEMIIDKEIFGKVSLDPQDVKNAYEKKKKSYQGPSGQLGFEESRPIIEKELMVFAVQKKEDKWISDLKKKAKIEIFLNKAK